MHWPLTGLLPPWAPGAAHMLWRQRPDVSQRQLVLGCQRCVKTVIQGPCWRQFNGTNPVLVDCPTQLTLISHLLIFPFISCSCSSIRKWNGQSDKITNFDGFSTFFCHFFPIWPHSHTYETNFEKKSALTWFSWLQWRLKVFTAAYRGLPPPTQLTNANIQRWEIRVSWVGQSTKSASTLKMSLGLTRLNLRLGLKCF